MDRKELLSRVKEEAGLDDLKQADRAVRVIVGLLKTMLPEEIEEAVAEKLPPDLRAGWDLVEPYPADILEREDIYFEGPGAEDMGAAPTITNG
jgi:uncharacterized protein (DUF2267 family)